MYILFLLLCLPMALIGMNDCNNNEQPKKNSISQIELATIAQKTVKIFKAEIVTYEANPALYSQERYNALMRMPASFPMLNKALEPYKNDKRFATAHSDFQSINLFFKSLSMNEKKDSNS